MRSAPPHVYLKCLCVAFSTLVESRYLQPNYNVSQYNSSTAVLSNPSHVTLSSSATTVNPGFPSESPSHPERYGFELSDEDELAAKVSVATSSTVFSTNASVIRVSHTIKTSSQLSNTSTPTSISDYQSVETSREAEPFFPLWRSHNVSSAAAPPATRPPIPTGGLPSKFKSTNSSRVQTPNSSWPTGQSSVLSVGDEFNWNGTHLEGLNHPEIASLQDFWANSTNLINLIGINETFRNISIPADRFSLLRLMSSANQLFASNNFVRQTNNLNSEDFLIDTIVYVNHTPEANFAISDGNAHMFSPYGGVTLYSASTRQIIGGAMAELMRLGQLSSLSQFLISNFTAASACVRQNITSSKDTSEAVVSLPALQKFSFNFTDSSGNRPQPLREGDSSSIDRSVSTTMTASSVSSLVTVGPVTASTEAATAVAINTVALSSVAASVLGHDEPVHIQRPGLGSLGSLKRARSLTQRVTLGSSYPLDIFPGWLCVTGPIDGHGDGIAGLRNKSAIQGGSYIGHVVASADELGPESIQQHPSLIIDHYLNENSSDVNPLNRAQSGAFKEADEPLIAGATLPDTYLKPAFPSISASEENNIDSSSKGYYPSNGQGVAIHQDAEYLRLSAASQTVAESQPAASFQPVAGAQPATVNQPAEGNQPSSGNQPTLGNQLSTGSQSATDNQPSAGNSPLVGTQPVTNTRPTVGDELSKGDQSRPESRILTADAGSSGVQSTENNPSQAGGQGSSQDSGGGSNSQVDSVIAGAAQSSNLQDHTEHAGDGSAVGDSSANSGGESTSGVTGAGSEHGQDSGASTTNQGDVGGNGIVPLAGTSDFKSGPSSVGVTDQVANKGNNGDGNLQGLGSGTKQMVGGAVLSSSGGVEQSAASSDSKQIIGGASLPSSGGLEGSASSSGSTVPDDKSSKGVSEFQDDADQIAKGLGIPADAIQFTGPSDSLQPQLFIPAYTTHSIFTSNGATVTQGVSVPAEVLVPTVAVSSYTVDGHTYTTSISTNVLQQISSPTPGSGLVPEIGLSGQHSPFEITSLVSTITGSDGIVATKTFQELIPIQSGKTQAINGPVFAASPVRTIVTKSDGQVTTETRDRIVALPTDTHGNVDFAAYSASLSSEPRMVGSFTTVVTSGSTPITEVLATTFPISPSSPGDSLLPSSFTTVITSGSLRLTTVLPAVPTSSGSPAYYASSLLTTTISSGTGVVTKVIPTLVPSSVSGVEYATSSLTTVLSKDGTLYTEVVPKLEPTRTAGTTGSKAPTHTHSPSSAGYRIQTPCWSSDKIWMWFVIVWGLLQAIWLRW